MTNSARQMTHQLATIVILLACAQVSAQDFAALPSPALTTMRELFSEPTWQWSDAATPVEHPTGMHELACVLTQKETMK